MRRDRSKTEQESRRRRIEFLTSDQAPAQERGKAVLFLLAHACAYLLLIAAEATWAAITGVRVWRRRQTGLAASVRGGAHKPTLAVLLAVRLAYLVSRRAGLAWLNRRADDYAAQRRATA
jgi:hypothetical protein